MESNILRELLHKYFHDELTGEELNKLRSIVNEISDETFKKELDFIWNNDNYVTPMDTFAKSDILRSIHNRIKPDTTIVRKIFNWWKMAAIIMMPVMLISLSLLFMDDKKESIANAQEYTILSGKGQKNQILLPDGTHVWLNSGSEIIYTSDFNLNNRNIKLKGEAYFDVKKSKRLPFNVEVDSINIQVLGTAFNVSAYSDDSDIKVSLERGKVKVRKLCDNRLLATMKPNEQATVNRKDMQTIISDCETSTEGVWRHNVLKLSNVYANEMIKKIERWYGVNITVQNMPELKKYGLTIKDESLREMLELINLVTPISYRIEGEEVVIRYK